MVFTIGYHWHDKCLVRTSLLRPHISASSELLLSTGDENLCCPPNHHIFCTESLTILAKNPTGVVVIWIEKTRWMVVHFTALNTTGKYMHFLAENPGRVCLNWPWGFCTKSHTYASISRCPFASYTQQSIILRPLSRHKMGIDRGTKVCSGAENPEETWLRPVARHAGWTQVLNRLHARSPGEASLLRFPRNEKPGQNNNNQHFPSWKSDKQGMFAENYCCTACLSENRKKWLMFLMASSALHVLFIILYGITGALLLNCFLKVNKMDGQAALLSTFGWDWLSRFMVSLTMGLIPILLFCVLLSH